MFKGEMTNWNSLITYDDGTNGDETAEDHIWTIVVPEVSNGSHQWGLEDDAENWLIVGDNLVVEVDAEGNISGDVSYTISGE